MKSLLIGEAATGADIARVRAVFAADPRVERIVSLETQQLGPDELFVGAHVVLDDALSGEDAAVGDRRDRRRGAGTGARGAASVRGT